MESYFVFAKLRNRLKIKGKPYLAPDPSQLPNVQLLEEAPFTITSVDFLKCDRFFIYIPLQSEYFDYKVSFFKNILLLAIFISLEQFELPRTKVKSSLRHQ